MFDSNYNANSILPLHHQNNNNNISLDDHLLNNFPSHLLDDEFFLDTILPYHNHHPPPPPPPPQPPEQQPQRVMSKEHKKVVRKAAGNKQDGGGGGSSKRKAGKKDRHSKIYTAHGPRDRRMRLSLQIARKFFDLQDMLGFDKASKTIEWLFNKSRAAIKDLSEKSCTNIMSPLQDFDGDYCSNKKEKFMMSNKGGMVCEVNEKRKQARARARERTKEKLMKNQKECNLEIEENPNNKNNNTLDDVIRVDKVHQLEDQMASVGIIENFLASSSSSSSMPNFSHHGAHHLISRGFSMVFPGNRASENGSGDVGLMQELVGHSEYTNHVQGLNCAFMDRSYNQGF